MKSDATFGSVFLAALLVSGPAWAGTVKTGSYGVTKDGATVHIFTMTNNHGLRAQVLDYGGIVCAVEAPGRDGKMANVILCQKDLKGIEANGTGSISRSGTTDFIPRSGASCIGRSGASCTKNAAFA